MPQSMRDAYENHMTLIAGEAAISHCELFETYQDRYPPKLREFVLKGRTIGEQQIRRCIQRRRQFQIELDGLVDELDLLLTPSAPGAAPKGLANTGDPRMNLIFTHTGVPSLTLSVQLNEAGLPLGVQVAARRDEDIALVGTALRIEQIIGFNASPSPGKSPRSCDT